MWFQQTVVELYGSKPNTEFNMDRIKPFACGGIASIVAELGLNNLLNPIQQALSHFSANKNALFFKAHFLLTQQRRGCRFRKDFKVSNTKECLIVAVKFSKKKDSEVYIMAFLPVDFYFIFIWFSSFPICYIIKIHFSNTSSIDLRNDQIWNVLFIEENSINSLLLRWRNQ